MHARRTPLPFLLARHAVLVLAGVFALGLLGACAQTPNRPARDPQTISVTPVRDPVVGRSTFESPIQIPSQPTVMVPFSITSEKGWFDNDDQFRNPDDTRSRGYARVAVANSLADRWSGLQHVRWHNVVFRNLQSGEERSLLDQRAVISGFVPLCYIGVGATPFDQEKKTRTAGLAFVVTTRDTNRNGALDAGDSQTLVLTGPNGENPHVTTPEGAAVTTVVYLAETNKLLIELRADTNDDGKIDFDDEPLQWVCDVPTGVAKPLISPETAAKVRAILK